MSSRNILILALALFAKISVSLQSYLDKYFLVYHAKNTNDIAKNLEERSSKLSAYEIVQMIIGVNLLIVSVVSACAVALKKDNKK